MELKKTQKQVLKILYEFKENSLTPERIANLSGVNLNHVNQALKKFLDNNYVYPPNEKGETSITDEGEDAYLRLK